MVASSRVEIIDHRLCTEVRKPIDNAGNVSMWPLSLISEERQLAGFIPTELCLYELEPRTVLSGHYHKQRQEIIIPLDSVVLCFADLQIPGFVEELFVPVKLVMSAFYFKLGIGHAVFNPSSLRIVKILVLTNMIGDDIVPYDFVREELVAKCKI